MRPLKVMLCASSELIHNGYSFVAYNLAKHIATKRDIDLIYWGFQRFNPNPEHEKGRQLPSNVRRYDAWANENPKQMGFGFDQIADFVDQEKPEVVVVYNDFVVVSTILEKLKKCEWKDFKKVIYIDQVYLSQKKEFIARLNQDADFIITFTPYWDMILKEQGMTKPSDWVQHGFDPMKNYKCPKKLARMYYGLKQDDFIVINTCRNTNRKRCDIMMQAWAEFISMHRGEAVKLLIATHVAGPQQAAYNLLEIYERELRLHGITIEEGMRHIILIDNPQQLTDEEVNILYNCADVGINTTMGAGFELTNFEHAGMGFPQVAPYIGGIRDFLDETVANVVKPCMVMYTDNVSDGCPGAAEVCSYKDYAEAIDKYYKDPELRREHGEKARKRILENYRWVDLGEKFYTLIVKAAGRPVNPDAEAEAPAVIDLADITALERNLNITKLSDDGVAAKADGRTPLAVVEEEDDELESAAAPAPAPQEPTQLNIKLPELKSKDRKDDIRNRLRKKLEDKKKKIDMIKKQIEKQ